MRKAKNRKLLSPVTLKYMPVLKTKQISPIWETGYIVFRQFRLPRTFSHMDLAYGQTKNLKRIFKDYSGNYKTNYKSELHDFD